MYKKVKDYFNKERGCVKIDTSSNLYYEILLIT